MTRLRRTLLAAAIAALCCFDATVHADPLVLTLTNPNQTGAPGTTITFSASVTNTGATSSTIDDIIFGCGLWCIPSIVPFNTNFDNQTVASGATLGPLPLFTVTIDPAAELGFVINGTVNLIYGPVRGATNFVPFTVTVVAPTAPVPEPATLVLLGTGLAGLGAAARRRRKATRVE